MHVLTVLDHPNPQSFSAAVAESFMDGVRSSGHTTELADLHAEGFDPRWTMSDASSDKNAPPDADVLRERARIDRADAICLVFPLFWWGMPSMTKGWVDRVWGWGWAYDQLDDREVSMQKPRTGLLLVPAGAREETIVNEGYQTALDLTWTRGTFGYFGWSPRRLEILYGSEGSQKRLEALLQRSFDLGAALPEPQPRENQPKA